MQIRKKRKQALSIFCLLTSQLLIAAPETSWFCTSRDVDKKTWSIKHSYQKPAIALALDACKKQSRVPKSCKLLESECDFFVNGISTKPIWQCEALDERAAPWPGKLHPDLDTAALSAKANCKENSSVPESCYIHPFTCTNIQEKQ